MGIALARPLWLLLLLLLPLVAWQAWCHQGMLGRGRLRLALALRLLLLTCLILALAGLQGVRRSKALTVVFVLDRSESLSPEQRQAAETWVGQAIAAMPLGDRAAVVAFGQDALVERVPSNSPVLDPVTSIPLTGGSDIAGAIRLGLALLPGDTAGRLVLLSDGLETAGQARAAVRLAAARGIEVDVVPLGAPPQQGEARLAQLQAPSAVRQGQYYELVALVESTVATEAMLGVLSSGVLVEQRVVSLSPGENRFYSSLQAEESGFQRHEAYLQPRQDTWVQNNRAAAFTVVLGPPRLLLVEGAAGEARDLALALEAAGLPAEIVAPAQLPNTAEALANYDAVFLVDAPARELPVGALELLRSYVRDLGRGLAMSGGPASFGRGGYLRTPVEELLPVDLRPRDRSERPGLALVLVLDRSGSMSDSGAMVGGPSKLELAVDAAVQSAQLLEEGDLLGVVAFDTAAQWVLPLAEVDAEAAAQALSTLDSGGGTSIFAGLSTARDAILQAEAPLRHVILLSDGWSEGGDYDALVQELADEGVTTSIIAIGEEPAAYLQGLAELGGGRYFWVRQPQEIPQVLLEETVTSMGAYVIEETFQPLPGRPSPVLTGLPIEALPPLGGYNGSWPKGTALVALYTHRGDPLLAHWNYGLGRSLAWTSDLKGEWAAQWVEWEGFSPFAAQVVAWLLPLPDEGELQLETELQDRRLHLVVESQDQAGRPRDFFHGQAVLLGPELQRITTTLSQTAPGRYEAEAELPQVGVYLLQVQLLAPDGRAYQRQGGVVLPYSPEYRSLLPDPAFMGELAAVGGGRTLGEPPQAFAQRMPPVRAVRDWGAGLLLAAVLLLPLDIAARRLRLSRGELRAFVCQLWAALPRPKRAAPEEAVLPRPLLGTVRRLRREKREQQPARPAPPPTTSQPAPSLPDPPAAPGTAAGDSLETLSRLRQAKKRARGEEP
ncbi:MAG: VWA domain-containing protein [Chloroflexia bacterium]|nr:VWA domain-containing protein [Chloroflexia bacterium]